MGAFEPTTLWPTDGEAMIEDYERALVGAPEDPGLRRQPRGAFVGLRPATLTSLLAGTFLVGALTGWALSNLADARDD